MRKPLGQEDMAYTRKRLEKYTDDVRNSNMKLDIFDFAVILEEARTLFSHAVLLQSIIATSTQQVSCVTNLYLSTD